MSREACWGEDVQMQNVVGFMGAADLAQQGVESGKTIDEVLAAR